MNIPQPMSGFLSVLVLAGILGLAPFPASAASANGDAVQPAPSVEEAPPAPAPERPLWPERPSPGHPPAWNPEPVPGVWMWRYFLALLVVAILMIGTFLGLRQLRGALGRGAAPGGLRLLARLPLDRHNTLYLLRTGGEDLVLAGGARGVRVLARHAAEPESEAQTGNPPPSFLDLLRTRQWRRDSR